MRRGWELTEKEEKRKGLSDSPFKCKFRNLDKCEMAVNPSFCPDKQNEGKCCLFCKKLWVCVMCCPKVISYLTYERSNPKKFSPREKRAIKEIEYKIDVREIGNPSIRKNQQRDSE